MIESSDPRLSRLENAFQEHAQSVDGQRRMTEYTFAPELQQQPEAREVLVSHFRAKGFQDLADVLSGQQQ